MLGVAVDSKNFIIPNLCMKTSLKTSRLYIVLHFLLLNSDIFLNVRIKRISYTNFWQSIFVLFKAFYIKLTYKYDHKKPQDFFPFIFSILTVDPLRLSVTNPDRLGIGRDTTADCSKIFWFKKEKSDRKIEIIKSWRLRSCIEFRVRSVFKCFGVV